MPVMASKSSLSPRLSKLSSMFSEMQEKSDTSMAQWLSRLHKAHEWFEKHGHADAFLEAFVRNMCVALIAKERNEFVQRILEVAASFAASFVVKDKEGDNNEAEAPHPFFAGLLDWLLDHHEARSSNARLSICHMINRLLMNLGEEACLDDELYVKIHDSMLVRIKDRVADIRCQAVLALTRLQDPRDKDCPVLKAFLFHLSKDSSAAVRQGILRTIGASKLTLPHVLRRLADVDEKVRKTAFSFIGEKVHIKSLTIAQREHILRRGFDDRSDAVNAVVQREIIPTWLRLCNGSIVELLYALDVGSASDKKIAGKVLSVLFKGVPYKELLESFHFLDNHKLIPFAKLTSETAIYWKSLAFYLQHEDNADANECLDQLFPELTTFCKYLQHFMLELDHSKVGNQNGTEEEEESDDVTWRFVSKQLIDMIALFDLADEVGRTNLGLLCRTLLASPRITAEFVEPLVTIFSSIRINTKQRLTEMAEIISDLREPLREQMEELQEQQEQQTSGFTKAQMEKREEEERAKKVEVAKVRVALNVKDSELQQAVDKKNFAAAQTLQLELENLKAELQAKQAELEQFSLPYPAAREEAPQQTSQQDTQPSQKSIDPEISLKCLRIIYYTMQDPKIKSLDPTLVTLVEEFILPTFGDVNSAVRNAAIDALVVCALRSIDLAKRQLFLLLQVAYLDDTEVRLTAWSGVNDLLMWHGLPAFMSQEDNGNEDGGEDRANPSPQVHPLTQTDLNRDGGESVVALFVNMLASEEEEVVAKVAECLCKLLMIGAISSPKLLQRLMLLWYNPVMEGNNRLRHILGTFFPLFASLKRSHQDSLEEAFLPTLKTIAQAPMSSPLSQINKDDVAAFFLHLTREDFLQAKECEGINLHDGMAFAIINEIIAHPDNGLNKCLCKALGNLQLTPDDSVKLRELHQHYEEMRVQLRDPLLRRTLVKFGNNLAAWLAHAPQSTSQTNEVENENTAENENLANNGKENGINNENEQNTQNGADNIDDKSEEGSENRISSSSIGSRKKTLFTNSQDSSLLNPSEEIESVSSSILGSNIIMHNNDESISTQRESRGDQRTQIQETDDEEDNEEDKDGNDESNEPNHTDSEAINTHVVDQKVVSPLKTLPKGGKKSTKKSRLEVDSNSNSSQASSDTDSAGGRTTRSSTNRGNKNTITTKSLAEREVGDRSRKARRVLSSTDEDSDSKNDEEQNNTAKKAEKSKKGEKQGSNDTNKKEQTKKGSKSVSSSSSSSASSRLSRRHKSALNLGDNAKEGEKGSQEPKRRSQRISRTSK